MKNRVVTYLGGLQDPALDQQVQLIGIKMKDNPYFPTLAEQAAQAAIVAGSYHEALLKAQGGSKEDRDRKADARAAVVEVFRDLAVNINRLAKGDKTLLDSTGYPLAKNTSRRKSKEGISIEEGTRSVTLTLASNPDGTTYMVRYTAFPVAEDSKWTEVPMTEKVLVVGDLESEHRYAFAFAPIVHGASMMYSDTLVSWYVK